MSCPKSKPYIQLSLEPMDALIRALFFATQARVVWAVVPRRLETVLLGRTD